MKQVLLRAAAAVLVAAAPFSALADYSYSLTVDGIAGDSSIYCYKDSSTGGGLSAACNGGANGQLASGSASVIIGTGHLGVAAMSIIDASFVPGSAYTNVIHSHATAGLNDVLRVNSSSHSGWGTLTFRLYLDRQVDLRANAAGSETHLLGSMGTATAEVNALAYLGAHSSLGQVDGLKVTYSGFSGETTTTRSTGGVVDNMPVASGLGYLTFSVPIVFNQDFGMTLELRGHPTASGWQNAAGAATLSAMNSLDWGGIVGISAGDQAVFDYTVTSASGTDWTRNYAPTPEPGRLALFLVGLAGMGSTTRRRARQSPSRHRRNHEDCPRP
jgi:hypothetical protein